MKIAKDFRITQRQITKVVTGRLYKGSGTKFEKYFSEHKRAHAGNTIDCYHEAEVSRDEEEVMYVVEGGQTEGGNSIQLTDLEPVRTLVQETPYFPRREAGTVVPICLSSFRKRRCISTSAWSGTKGLQRHRSSLEHQK